MPLVRIDILEGRPPETIERLHSEVAALVAEIIGSPLDRIRTYVTEIPAENWGIGGVPASVARKAEVDARRAAAAEQGNG
jgi:4-oxalocrotonate tautomerase